MEKTQASEILRMVFENVSTQDVTKVMVMPSVSEDMYSNGSQIYIEANFDEKTKQTLETKLKQNDLALKQEGNRIIIYKPLKIIKVSM
ncbi:MAG: hypothetical protein GX638_09595 [Crenarchaeota archaeon]|nr:hypothetical protein [Thermoproteota archaeon]